MEPAFKSLRPILLDLVLPNWPKPIYSGSFYNSLLLAARSRLSSPTCLHPLERPPITEIFKYFNKFTSQGHKHCCFGSSFCVTILLITGSLLPKRPKVLGKLTTRAKLSLALLLLPPFTLLENSYRPLCARHKI